MEWDFIDHLILRLIQGRRPSVISWKMTIQPLQIFLGADKSMKLLSFISYFSGSKITAMGRHKDLMRPMVGRHEVSRRVFSEVREAVPDLGYVLSAVNVYEPWQGALVLVANFPRT